MNKSKNRAKTEDEIVALLKNQINSAISGSENDSQSEQALALDRYYGRLYGNEVEGESQVTTRELFETIQWILPSLLRPFTSGSRYVEFDPVGPEDEALAEQETDVVNHVIAKHNDAFMLFHDWFKDALLMRNSYVKIYFDETPAYSSPCSYEGISDEEWATVLEDDDIEVLEHSEYIESVTTKEGIKIDVVLHDIKIRKIRDNGRVKVIPVASEDMLVSSATRGLMLNDSPFVAHRAHKTVSDLISEGFDRELVESLPDRDYSNNQIEVARNQSASENTFIDNEVDDSQRELLVYDCYVLIDEDGDGKSELRNIVISGDQILSDEEVEFIPFSCISPIPMPHKHEGMSYYDAIKDLQFQKTTLMRQIFNNLYLTNNPEKEVVERQVNMEDLLESLPGGVKRVTEIGSIREITVPFTAQASFPILELLDQSKEARTGVSRHTQGLDANTLSQTTEGAFMGAMENANQVIEMIARIFAESGVKDMFRKVHATLVKHRDIEMIVKLKGEYISVNPSEWQERTDLTTVVGLGTGNRDQQLTRLLSVAREQKAMFLEGVPIVQPDDIYNTWEKIIEVSDLKDVTRYFTDPKDIPPKQPQPDPNLMMIQSNERIEFGKLNIKKQELDLKSRELRIKEVELGIKEEQHAEDMDFQQSKAVLDADTKIKVAKIGKEQRA